MLYDGKERSHVIKGSSTKKSGKKKYHSAIGTLVSKEHDINIYMEESLWRVSGTRDVAQTFMSAYHAQVPIFNYKYSYQK